MAQEIERKFLLTPNVFTVLNENIPERVSFIHQGYISDSEKGVLRVRKEDNVTVLTCKGRGLLSRIENEILVDSKEFSEQLWSFVTGTIIQKTRLTFQPIDRLPYTIDIFHESLEGLVMMEIEFPSLEEANAYTLPDWAQSAREVTEDTRYANSSLARHGLP